MACKSVSVKRPKQANEETAGTGLGAPSLCRGSYFIYLCLFEGGDDGSGIVGGDGCMLKLTELSTLKGALMVYKSYWKRTVMFGFGQARSQTVNVYSPPVCVPSFPNQK